jgi:hypothetical protein
MMKLVIKRADGGVAICDNPNDPDRVFNNFVEQAKLAYPQWLPATFELIEVDLPTDRAFRDAWTFNGGAVEVDMPKARDIHMKRIRGRRNKKLKDSDIEMMIATEKNDAPAVAALKLMRQRLRDLPQNTDLDSASTPDELKAIWPAELE